MTPFHSTNLDRYMVTTHNKDCSDCLISYSNSKSGIFGVRMADGCWVQVGSLGEMERVFGVEIESVSDPREAVCLLSRDDMMTTQSCKT
jgi:hypothetical protein